MARMRQTKSAKVERLAFREVFMVGAEGRPVAIKMVEDGCLLLVVIVRRIGGMMSDVGVGGKGVSRDVWRGWDRNHSE